MPSPVQAAIESFLEHAMPPITVWTNRYDNARTGANLQETTLNTTNVNSSQFGKLFTRAVDGDIYAQPLVVPGVRIKGKDRTVVYVATANNSLYAFDAEDPAASAPYWHLDQQSLGPPVSKSEVGPQNYRDFSRTIGITSTPVIDAGAGVLYLVAKSKQNGVYFHHLHALDLATGNNRADFNSPMPIAAQVAGTAADGHLGLLTFDPRTQLNRPGLLLENGTLYLAFGSHGDQAPYHGWVLSYDARTLAQTAAFCSTPNGSAGGIWQSGAGLASDGQFIYAVAGNGTFGAPDFGESVIQLDPAHGLAVAHAFAPANAAWLVFRDLDLSTGPVLLPGTELALACSKEGKGYLLNRADMSVAQEFVASDTFVSGLIGRLLHESNIHGAPVVWNSPEHGAVIYVWGEYDYLRCHKLGPDGFALLSRSTMHAPPGMPGGMLTLSADGSSPGTGVLWAAHPYLENANLSTVDGILRAFDASDTTRELWNSKQSGRRDDVGKFAKFCPPTVANGKVYLATFADPAATDPTATNELVVYGLFPGAPPPPPSPWRQADVSTPVVGGYARTSGRFTVMGAGDDIEGAADSFHFVYQEMAGDGVILARVRSVGSTNAWAKAGVMIRETLYPESAHAMMVLTPGNGAAFQRRVRSGDPLQHTPGPAVQPAYWVKMERQGDTFTGSVSPDGEQWTAVGAETIPMTPTVRLGLAVTAHDGSLTQPLPINTSIFDGVRVNGQPG